jgi:drug/metabolite transporter (DMT)-like permease
LISTAAIAYVLCALICAGCAGLLYRSWRRYRSRLVRWVAIAFMILTASNVLLVIDLYVSADLSMLRALLVALGLGVLTYGLAWEEQQ